MSRVVRERGAACGCRPEASRRHRGVGRRGSARVPMRSCTMSRSVRASRSPGVRRVTSSSNERAVRYRASALGGIAQIGLAGVALHVSQPCGTPSPAPARRRVALRGARRPSRYSSPVRTMISRALVEPGKSRTASCTSTTTLFARVPDLLQPVGWRFCASYRETGEAASQGDEQRGAGRRLRPIASDEFARAVAQGLRPARRTGSSSR